MDVLALILGVVLAGSSSYAEARYVSRRWRQRGLPAFAHPNIHSWNRLPKAVPLRMLLLLLRVGSLVAGVILLGVSVWRDWTIWWWAGVLLYLTATILPAELVRRRHNRRVEHYQVGAEVGG